MPLDEIVLLLRWLAAVLTLASLGAAWAVVAIIGGLDRLSRQLDCAIQQADEDAPVSTSADEPDGNKMPELAPWHGEDRTVDHLVARRE